MESAVVGIGGVLFVAVLFGILSKIEAGRRRRMLADVTRTTAVRRYDLSGDLLPREETSLGPVDYRRIADAQPAGYILTTQQARHAPTLQASFAAPALTAAFTAIALTLACGVLALAFGWSGRVVALTFALSLVIVWLWRLGFADRVLWSVESWTGKDLDHDQQVGRPLTPYAVVNPSVARATAARAERTTAEDARQAALLAFVDVCYLKGCSEGAHGITASGPERENYVACRDVLFNLGLAAWKNLERPKGGWRLTTDPATCKGILAGHVA
jgi:hypothetical protein